MNEKTALSGVTFGLRLKLSGSVIMTKSLQRARKLFVTGFVPLTPSQDMSKMVIARQKLGKKDHAEEKVLEELRQINI